MIYPELAAFDSTKDQDAALTLQRAEDSGTPTATNGAYAVLILNGIMNDYVLRHISSKTEAKLVEAFGKASVADKAAVAAILKVDVSDAEVKP